MRHSRTIIIGLVVAAAVAISGTAVALTGGSPKGGAAAAKTSGPSAAPTPSTASAAAATVHTISATVNGTTETVLANGNGLPLYYYKPDTAATSLVSGGLAALWPPLVANNPTVTGANGQITTNKAVHGGQVAYNGHFLYTFVDDSPGQVTGQGVQDFLVVTPGLAASGSAPTSTTRPAPTSAPGSGNSYSGGY